MTRSLCARCASFRATHEADIALHRGEESVYEEHAPLCAVCAAQMEMVVDAFVGDLYPDLFTAILDAAEEDEDDEIHDGD